MVGEIAKLRCQLVKAQQLREEAQLRQKKLELHQKDTERQAELNSLSGLLNGCHKLSQAIRVTTNVTLIPEDTTNPVNRLFPRRIRHWNEFPEVQEKIWDRLNRDRTFTRKRRFRNNYFLDEIHKHTRRHTIFSVWNRH